MYTLYDFWGKAERSGPRFHPAILHMLDAGIVASQLLATMSADFQEYFLKEFADDIPYAHQLVKFLTSLHDLGKISPGFQGKGCVPHARGGELQHRSSRMDR